MANAILRIPRLPQKCRWVVLAWLAGTTLCGAGKPLTIKIQNAGWKASHEDIRRVLESSANTMWKHIPGEKLDAIEVGRSHNGPIVLYERAKSGAYRVRLDTGQQYWSQYAYQFAHEFCHILCKYRDGPNPHKWFEETLCETASLFALRDMARTWQTKPPYRNWKSYHASLADYARDRIEKAGQSGTLAEWFQKNSPRFNTPEYTRRLEHEAATFLLPYFEKDPTRWAALQTLYRPEHPPAPDFSAHLKEWEERAPKKHKAFIAELRQAFGIP